MLDTEGIRAEPARSHAEKCKKGNVGSFGLKRGVTRVWVLRERKERADGVALPGYLRSQSYFYPS